MRRSTRRQAATGDGGVDGTTPLPVQASNTNSPLQPKKQIDSQVKRDPSGKVSSSPLSSVDSSQATAKDVNELEREKAELPATAKDEDERHEQMVHDVRIDGGDIQTAIPSDLTAQSPIRKTVILAQQPSSTLQHDIEPLLLLPTDGKTIDSGCPSAVDLDVHRTKRARTELFEGSFDLLPSQAELPSETSPSYLLQEINPVEFDFLPSSDPAAKENQSTSSSRPASPTSFIVNGTGHDNSLLQANMADDSGVFMMHFIDKEDDSSRVRQRDLVEATKEENGLIAEAEAEIDLDDGMGGMDAQAQVDREIETEVDLDVDGEDEFEFEGDEMWTTYEEGIQLTQPVVMPGISTPQKCDRGIMEDDESMYWTAGCAFDTGSTIDLHQNRKDDDEKDYDNSEEALLLRKKYLDTVPALKEWEKTSNQDQQACTIASSAFGGFGAEMPMAGFKSVGGKTITFSEKALLSARALMQDIFADGENVEADVEDSSRCPTNENQKPSQSPTNAFSSSPRASNASIPSFSAYATTSKEMMSVFEGFTTGGGSKLAPPSEASLAKAKARLESTESDLPEDHQELTNATPNPAALRSPLLPVKNAQLISEDFRSNAASTIRSPTGTQRSDLYSTEVRRPQTPTLRKSTDSFLSKPTPKDSPQTKCSTPARSSFSTPTLRRLNIGLTTRPRPPSHQQKFVSPFRGGIRPIGLTPTGVLRDSKETTINSPELGSSISRNSTEVQSQIRKGKEKASERQDSVSLNRADAMFDLTSTSPRKPLKQCAKPGILSYDDLQNLGISEEVLSLTLSRAKSFVFDCGRGEEEALSFINACPGGSYATLPWIKNHWQLIVWKLASIVRCNPEVLEQYWSWETAVRQIQYRYEREINLAQRSCIKRIQEQDSPSTLPLVLCVAQIQYAGFSGGEEDSYENTPDINDANKMIIGLELTDGWYRIKSNVDATLKDACKRRKIVVGSKLSIVGAKLNSSGREGIDVLEALNKSSLMISANSTALAPWYTRLGFTVQRFISTLESLTPGGGVTSLLRVVVENIFPYGYIDIGKSDHGAWNEDEEREKASKWENGKAKAEARLADELDKATGEWDGIIFLLQDAVERLGPPPISRDRGLDTEPSVGGDEPDVILDQLEAIGQLSSSNEALRQQRAIVNRLSPLKARECLDLAIVNAVLSKQQAVSDLQQEIAISYPPRKVRGFRVLRIRDAYKELGDSRASTALLTVWDANALGQDFFQEKQVYMVSNVVPKGSWHRKSREISLATRRDSRWRVERELLETNVA